MTDKKPPVRHRRKLTAFLCREMLYDYELGTLDEDRRHAVEEFLKTDADCRNTLEGLRRGLKYGAELSRTVLHPEVVTGLNETENVVSLGRRYSSWRAWPDELKWTIGFVAVSLVVAGAASVIPWSKIQTWRPAAKTNTLELAQLSKPGDAEKLESQEAENPADQGSGDEEIETPDQAAVVTKPSAEMITKSKAKIAAADAANNEASDDGDDSGDAGDTEASAPPKPTPIAKTSAPTTAVAAVAAAKSVAPTKPEPAPPAAAPAPTTKATAKQDDSEASEEHEGKPKGFVYRAFMNTANLDEVAPKITDQITELGGTKAGEVDLGWKRGSGRYYHFALPEDNQEKLLEKLRAYGPVRISKDPHSRVMPAGQVRFILWVEASH